MSRLPLSVRAARTPALVLAPAAATAAQAQAPAVPATRIDVIGAAIVPIDDAATRKRTGAFALSDGRTLRVVRPNLP